MKPLFLKMTAFGPFNESVDISFDRVFDGGLFLIHGRTGAGKTSILDGICFALFGRPSSEEREKDLSSIRSDSAAAELMTEVDLVFAIGGQAYRVHRAPAQKRPKKRAGKNTDASMDFRGSAELFKLDGGLRELRESKDIETLSWQPLAGKMEAVKSAVEALIGMDEKQFRQVIVLPQGRFREFLSSSSTERQIILEKLFQTDRFSRFQTHVSSQARALEGRFKDSSQQLEANLRAHGLESFSDISPRRENFETQNSNFKQQLSVSRKQVDELTQELHRALEAEKTKAREAQLELERQRLEKESSEISRKKFELQKFRSWAPYFLIDSSLTEAENKRKLIENGLNLSLQSIQKLSAELDRLNADESLKKQQRPSLQEMTVELNRLRDTAKVLKDLETLKKETIESGQRVAQIAQVIEKQKVQKKTFNKNLVRLGRSLVSIDQDLSNIEAERISSEENGLLRLELQFHKNEVVRLAASLKDNQPCPVCGSKSHPQPAYPEPVQRPSTDSTVTEQQIAAKRRDLDRLKIETAERRSDRRAKLTATKNSHGFGIDPAFNDEESTLSKTSPGSPGPSESDFKICFTQFEIESQRLDTTDRELEKAVAELEIRKQNQAALQAALDQKLQTLSENDRDLDDVIRRGIGLKKSQEDLELALKNLAQKIGSTESELARSRGSHETQTAELQRAQTEISRLVDKKQTSLEAAVQTGNGTEAPKEIISESDSLKFLADIQNHDLAVQKVAAALHEIHEIMKSLTSRASGERNLGQIRIEAQSAQNRRGELEAAIAKNTVQIESLSRLEKEHRSELVQLDALKREAERATKISGLLTGDRSQNKLLVPLARFALQSRFEDVLEQANRRLTIMSRGQYLLRRPALSGNLRDSQGLELTVEDALTGKERHAGSLSGGESFMAALSLALGLADVVQADLGGLRLDTVLIDEGFGTLDAESLDLAVRTLIDLQSGGRFVGIISHVQELKSQIQNQLEVTKLPSGSRAQWNQASF